MSLISDALKTAQRERTGRAQSARDPQPLIDGFFPYVSTAPSRRRGKSGLIIALSGLAVVLLAAAGWVMWPTLTKSGPASKPAPIVLPPRVATTGTPPSTDTAAVAATEREVVAADPVDPSTENRQAPAPRQSSGAGTRAVTRSAVPAVVSADSVIVRRDQSIPRAPVVRAEPIRVDYEAQAALAFNAGDLTSAREKFMLATRSAPTARVWTNYGVTLQRLGDLSGASAAYQSAIGIDPNYLEAWLYQGRLAVQQGDVARAIPLFQRARAINPRHSDVNVELARLESEAKNWSQTRRFAEDAVRADPSNARAQWYLAVSSDELKDVDVAIRAYAAYLQTVGGAEREQAEFVGWARTRLAQLRGRP